MIGQIEFIQDKNGFHLSVDGEKIQNYCITGLSLNATPGRIDVQLGLYIQRIELNDEGNITINECIGREALLREVYERLRMKFEPVQDLIKFSEALIMWADNMRRIGWAKDRTDILLSLARYVFNAAKTKERKFNEPNKH